MKLVAMTLAGMITPTGTDTILNSGELLRGENWRQKLSIDITNLNLVNSVSLTSSSYRLIDCISR